MEQRDEPSDVLAFDVGGANTKAADGLGWICTEPLPLWERPHDLTPALSRHVRERRPRRIVATMTGEIADCFPSRAAGVRHIVGSLTAAAGSLDPVADVAIYLVDGTLVSPAAACDRPLAAAASNWHAMARLAASLTDASRVVAVDVGSTTCDIIPVVDRIPDARGLDDVGRLATGELVYTGVERTPVAAIVRSLPWPRAGAGRRPIASERYADSRDAWLLLGGIPEDPASHDTADGRPATRAAAAARIARMLLADPETYSMEDAVAAAEWCVEAQARRVAAALRRVAIAGSRQPECVVLAGHGECLARRALGRLGWNVTLVSMTARLGAAVSRAACAHAVAMVARGTLP